MCDPNHINPAQDEQIGEMKLEIIEGTLLIKPKAPLISWAKGAISPISIENTLKDAWDIIKDSKPVVTCTDNNDANAIPKDCAIESLTGWKETVVKLHHSLTKNPRNFIDFKVAWSYDGNLNGKGRYITGARVLPDESIPFGHTVDAKIAIRKPLYDGTPDCPIAMLPFDITITHTKIIGKAEFRTWSGTMRGDGKFSTLDIPATTYNI